MSDIWRGTPEPVQKSRLWWKVQDALLSRGYKKQIIKPLIRRVRYKDRHIVLHKSKQIKEQTLSTPALVLTYNTHVSQIRRELNQIWSSCVEQNPLLNKIYPMPPPVSPWKRTGHLADQSLLSAPMNFNERYFIDFINNQLTQFTHLYFAGYFLNDELSNLVILDVHTFWNNWNYWNRVKRNTPATWTRPDDWG